MVKNIVEVFLFFSPMPATKLTKIALMALKAGKSEEGLLTQLPIVNRLKKYAPENELLSGLPFYIGMTKAKGNALDILNIFGLGSSEVLFKKVQNFSKDDMHKAIMASAALPLLFDAIEIDGTQYRDGCLGSTENEWGNTPAKPLVEEEGCTHLIVCHLDEGSFFDRHDPLFNNISIIEVRPETEIFSTLDPLMFKADKINQWIEQGYKDSKRIVMDSLNAIKGVEERCVAALEADHAINKLKKRNFLYSDV